MTMTNDPQTFTLPAVRTADGGTLTTSYVYTPPPPVVVTPPPAPNPTPVPVPTTPPPHGQHRGLWHHGWNGPPLGQLPADVRSRLTSVTLAMSQSTRAGTGLLNDPPGVTAQEVHALVADGVDVLVGVGGSGGAPTLLTAGNVDEAVQSLLSIRDRFGVTGVRWDLEDSPGSSWTVDNVVAASRRLLDAGLKVGQWSGTWGGRLAAWGAVAKALGAQLYSWERCYYDFPEANDAGQLVNVVNYDLPLLRPYVTREDQLACSFAPVGAMSHTSTAAMVAALKAARAQYAGVGFGVWEDYQDAKNADGPFAASRALAKV